MGIDAHFAQSVKQGTLDISKLWLANYIQSRPTESEDNEARVTLYIRVAQRNETLQFVDQKMSELKQKSFRATHLVEQVLYGAEFICCLRRNVDLSIETKIEAEDQMYWAAKTYYVQATTNSAEIDPPTELDNVSCVMYNSLSVGQVLQFPVLRNSVDWLKKTFLFTKDEYWRPVEISLRPIPAQLQHLIESDKKMKNEKEMELNWYSVWTESRILAKHPAIHRIPPLEKILDHFVNLLQPLRIKMEQFRTFELKRQEHVQHLLSSATDWLARLRHEIDSLNFILNGSQLDMSELSEIKSRPLTARRVDAFILHVDYKQDPLMEEIQKLLGYSSPDVKRPFFPIAAAGQDRLEEVGEALRSFSEEALLCSDDRSYQIGLVPSCSEIPEGSVESVVFPAVPPRKIPSLPPPLIPIFDEPSKGTTAEKPKGNVFVGPPPLKRKHESCVGSVLKFANLPPKLKQKPLPLLLGPFRK